MNTTERQNDWIDDWLSTPRFATYVGAAGGSRPRALELYEWNARLSAAFLHDLGHLEVGLRNAYDRLLSTAAVQGEGHWTEPQTLLQLFPVQQRTQRGRTIDVNKTARQKVETARHLATGGRRVTPPPGKVIAEITFGFWTYLTSDAHEKTLWVPYLHKAFPPGSDRKRINRTLITIRDFRNRVAHHEHILRGAEAQRRQIHPLVRSLSPGAASHLATYSEVATILAQRP